MAIHTLGTSGRPYTYADLEDMPDDGQKYELSYGTLVVTPAPNVRHQMIGPRLTAMLLAQAPPGEVVLHDAELRLQDDLLKIPDIMVVASELAVGQSVLGPPDLVVEIHSPSTRTLDQTEKRFVYASAGAAAYWMVDPLLNELTVLELRGGAYVNKAVVGCSDRIDLSVPFALRIDGAAIFS